MTVLEYVMLMRMLVVIALLVVVFVIDLEHYLILDMVVLPAAAVILIFNVVIDLLLGQQLLALSSYAITGLVAAVAGSGFFYVIWAASRGRWMGFGDVKFSLFLGMALGISSLVIGLFAAFMLGAIVGVGLMLYGRKTMASKVPFGTFLSAGALLALWYGPALWGWYLVLIGWQ
jgi:leader peptidase (prepilin peptidase)/N-methyltransferase